MRCCETIAPCRFTFVATVAEEIVFQSQALGQTTLSSIVFSTNDMRVTYHQIPT